MYLIGEFSEITGLGIHTLRYYEKEHLITPARNLSNRRCYSDKDLEWVKFIKRLKATGMPLKEIKRYSALRAEGEGTMEERMEMLKAHHSILERKIEELREHMAKLEYKIDYYQQEINNGHKDLK